MKNYIGLDVHSSTSTFCVVNEEGKEVENITFETNGKLLISYLRSIAGEKILSFEEGELSVWLLGILKKEVDKILVCNAVANRELNGPKTDGIDARKLAHLLRGGFLKEVYHDGTARERFRSLMAGYQNIVDEAVRFKNQYKSLYRKDGGKLTGNKLYNDASFLQGLKREDFKFIGTKIYDLLGNLEEIRNEYVEKIKACSQNFKEMKYLRTIPGIGLIQAAKIVSQVVEPRRFKDKYHFYSYCGLVRHKRISGDRLYGSKKIWGNRILKCVYKMAGHSAIRGQSGLRKYYDYLRLKGISQKNACNAVCRKIAAISLCLCKNKEKYNDRLLTNRIKNDYKKVKPYSIFEKKIAIN